VRGRLRLQCGEDCFQYAFEISDHVIIPKAEDAIAVLDEPFVSDSIALALRVLTTINFNDEPMFATNEVSDVRPYGLLANEFESIQATGAESPPEFSFRNRRIFAKPSR
jgi:hypothetical protein